MDALRLIPRKIHSQALLIFGLLLGYSMPAWSADELQTLTMVNHDYPPLIAQNLPYGGILTHIVTETFAAAGIKLQVEYAPNNRTISGVMAGLYSGSYGWAHAPDRDKKLLYSSEPIYTFRMVFFHRRGTEYPWKTLADLHPYRIGATLGDHYSDEFSALEAAGTLYVEYASDDESNLRKLLRGRIDLFPIEETCGQFLLADIFAPADQVKIVNQKNAVWSVPTYLVIRRDYPNAKEIIDRFDRSFRQMVRTGKLTKLIDEALAAATKAKVDEHSR